MKKLLTIVLLVHVAQSGAASLFEDSAALEVNVTGPFSSLLEEDDQKELRFVLRANDVSHSIKMRLRGNSRRRVCDFPPLRINFKVDDTAQSIFEGQDKLKLVTHCRYSNSRTRTAGKDSARGYSVFCAPMAGNGLGTGT